MGFGGLIAAAAGGLAKGVGDVAKIDVEKEAKLDIAREMSKMEEEKALRVAEAGKQLDIKYAGPMAEAQSKAKITAYDTEAPLREKQRAELSDEAKAKAEAEVAATKTLGGNKEYVSALRTLADAKEGSAARANAAESMFKLGQLKSIADLRAKLATTTDPAQRESLTQQLTDLSGANIKSASDVIGAATNWRMMAKDLRKDAESAVNDTDRADLITQAREYETLADSVQRTVVSRRLPGANVPKPGEDKNKPAATPGPWNNFTR